ncbi:MAG TPA: transporter associated domain-containing protein, partial [Verrucomicrobiae bacterium]|nr:transporter associated domain-containing protein [Verrucomicrobiae bacterium]
QRKETAGKVVERIGPGKRRVSGVCTVDEFRREFPALKEADDVDTMSGLFVQRMEYVPTAGEWIVIQGLRLTAKEVEDRRVRQLEVEVVKR